MKSNNFSNFLKSTSISPSSSDCPGVWRGESVKLFLSSPIQALLSLFFFLSESNTMIAFDDRLPETVLRYPHLYALLHLTAGFLPRFQVRWFRTGINTLFLYMLTTLGTNRFVEAYRTLRLHWLTAFLGNKSAIHPNKTISILTCFYPTMW